MIAVVVAAIGCSDCDHRSDCVFDSIKPLVYVIIPDVYDYDKRQCQPASM